MHYNSGRDILIYGIMDTLRDLLRRELASDANHLSEMLNKEFEIRRDGSRTPDDYVFEVEKALPRGDASPSVAYSSSHPLFVKSV